MSKYRNVRTFVDGHWFDSKREAARYQELRLLEKAGKIDTLGLQPRFALKVEGETIGHYVADFQYRENGSPAWVIEDAKGMRTALYRWKKKHMAAQYKIMIREV